MSWSNNPYRNQGGSYDRNLSIDAPRPPAQLWPGYDVNLLEGGQHQHSQYIQGLSGLETSIPTAAPPHPVHQAPQVFAGTENASKEQFVDASKPRTGFWRSRKGIITVVVIILVVIGAVVGGAVGGTTKKTSSSSSRSSSTNGLISSSTLLTATASITASGGTNPAASGSVASGSSSPPGHAR